MSALTSLMNGSKESVLSMLAFLQCFVESNATLKDGDSLYARAHNAGTVIAVVVIGIVALIGILIFGEVNAAMPSDHPLNSTADEIVGGFGDAMGLVPIILLVLLASVVIGVVQRMRG